MRLLLSLCAWSSLAGLATFDLPRAPLFLAPPAVSAAMPDDTLPASQTQPAARDENQEKKTGTIRGRVVVADTGAPLARVRMRLSRVGASDGGVLVSTDRDGQYESADLAPATYEITAEKIGFVKSTFGAQGSQDGGRPVQVAAGQMLDDIDLQMRRGGSVVVDVTDDLGEPFATARVNLEQYRFVNGERRLSAPFTAATDEVGRARFTDLPEGEYFVVANPTRLRLVVLDSSDSGRTLGSTYYPAATSITGAAKVRIDAGQEIGVKVGLLATRTVKVSGVLRSPVGMGSIGNLVLEPRPVGSSQRGDVATIHPDGSFTFSKVVPGSYVMRMRGRTEPRQYVDMPLEVIGDLTGVLVTTTTGGTVRGRITFDAGGAPGNVPLDAFALWAAPSWASVLRPGQFYSHEDGTFDLVGVVGRSVLRPRFPQAAAAGWFLKSITLDGADITDKVLDLSTGEISGVDVTFTRLQNELTGSAVDGRGVPIHEFVAVIFSEDRHSWTPQSRSVAAGRPDQQGRFRVTGLPPGRYLAAAVKSIEISEEDDVELLRRLEPRAVRLNIGENQKQSITLRLVP